MDEEMMINLFVGITPNIITAFKAPIYLWFFYVFCLSVIVIYKFIKSKIN